MSGTELGSGTEADNVDSTENRFFDFSEFDLTEFVLFEFELSEFDLTELVLFEFDLSELVLFEFEMFTTVLGGILSNSNIVELLEKRRL